MTNDQQVFDYLNGVGVGPSQAPAPAASQFDRDAPMVFPGAAGGAAPDTINPSWAPPPMPRRVSPPPWLNPVLNAPTPSMIPPTGSAPGGLPVPPPGTGGKFVPSPFPAPSAGAPATAGPFTPPAPPPVPAMPTVPKRPVAPRPAPVAARKVGNKIEFTLNNGKTLSLAGKSAEKAYKELQQEGAAVDAELKQGSGVDKMLQDNSQEALMKQFEAVFGSY